MIDLYMIFVFFCIAAFSFKSENEFPCFDITFIFKSCCFSFKFASSVLIYTLFIHYVSVFILDNSFWLPLN